jgi:CheY-like chemotaxis protein
MTKENPKAIVIEDMPNWREIISETLISAGVEVAVIAATLPAALEAIRQIQDGDIDLITLDGNLGKNLNNEDAQKILELIADLELNLTTIGMGTFDIYGVDMDIGKSRKALKEALEKLGFTA